MTQKTIYIFFQPLILIIVFLMNFPAYGQETLLHSVGDSLSLEQIMEIVVNDHPFIKKAEEGMVQASAKYGLAKTGRYPHIDALASASTVGPVSEFELGSLGTYQLYPRDNYSAGVNIQQNIYDFGKTTTNIELNTRNKELSEKTINVVKNKMAINVVKNYYALVFLQQAIRIKDEQLSTLKEHLAFVEKKKATGSGTDYEILSTQVKISRAESQKLEIETALEGQLAVMNSLMGLPATRRHVVKENLSVENPAQSADSLIAYAMGNRDELKINQQKTNIAELRLKAVKLKNTPTLDFIAKGGWKNGYTPDIEKLQAHYVVGVSFKMPLFDANQTKYNQVLAQSEIDASEYETENLSRTIATEVIEHNTALQKQQQQVEHAKVQLSQAINAYELAIVSFSAGSITNLDLLDAQTTVSESKLSLLKTQIDYVVGVYQLQVALGNPLY